jgi:hypothetical protein
MENDAPETMWANVAAVLEEQTKILLYHRQVLEYVLTETAELKRRLDELQSADSLDSSDVNSISDVSARLKAISKTLEQKP